MKKIGIISDTHAYWDDKYLHYFEPCDEYGMQATSVVWRWLRNWLLSVRSVLSVAIATGVTCD